MRLSDSHDSGVRPPLYLLILILLLFAARFGYAYAISDQDEILPLLLNLEDSSVLSTDWFVGTQTAHMSVRTYFVWLLLAASKLVPLFWATLALYIVCWIAVSWQVFGFAFRLTADQKSQWSFTNV